MVHGGQNPPASEQKTYDVRHGSAVYVAVALTNLCHIITCKHALTASAMAMEIGNDHMCQFVTIVQIGDVSIILRAAASGPLKTVKGLNG